MRSIWATACLISIMAIGCDDGGSSRAGAPTALGATTPQVTTPAQPVEATSQHPMQTPGPTDPEVRALWVTRWQANDEAKVRAAVELAQRLHMNTLFLQVMGHGYTLHPSASAPRSSLTASGFDPLATAMRLVQGTDIEVHAWINCNYVYSGTAAAPSDPKHVLNKHPDSSMVRSNGTRDFDQIGSGESIFACPAHPGFRAYLAEVSREIVATYPVAGIHLDYIRYHAGTDRCYCPEHKSQFQARYGRAPVAGDLDWHAFRFEGVNDMVRDIHSAITAVNPQAILSATRTGFFSFQDPTAWSRTCGLDMLVPMAYSRTTSRIEQRLGEVEPMTNGRQLVIGLSVTMGDLAAQLDLVRARGYAGFALFASNQIDAQHETLIRQRLTQPVSTPGFPHQDGSADTTPPRLFNVQAVEAGARIAVRWNTDESTLGRVELREAGAPWSQATLHLSNYGAANWDHEVLLTGLPAGSDYTLHVVATDSAGNWRASADHSVHVAGGTATTVIIDDQDPGYTELSRWSDGSSTGGHNGSYRYISRNNQVVSAEAHFKPLYLAAGTYDLSAFAVGGTNRVRDANVIIEHAGGSSTVAIDQTHRGGQWLDLGRYSFAGTGSERVRITNYATSSGVVIADAVRFTPVAP